MRQPSAVDRTPGGHDLSKQIVTFTSQLKVTPGAPLGLEVNQPCNRCQAVRPNPYPKSFLSPALASSYALALTLRCRLRRSPRRASGRAGAPRHRRRPSRRRPRRHQVYVYPTGGQTQDQLGRDRYECHLWAVKQSNFDPSVTAVLPRQRVQVVPMPPSGSDTVAGAVTGAIIGAVVAPRSGCGCRRRCDSRWRRWCGFRRAARSARQGGPGTLRPARRRPDGETR